MKSNPWVRFTSVIPKSYKKIKEKILKKLKIKKINFFYCRQQVDGN